jgi:hypothetical protein
MLQNRLNHLDL